MSTRLANMSVLCQRCQLFDIQSFPDNNFPWKSYSKLDVRKSAREGCAFCTAIVKALPVAFDGSKKSGDIKIGNRIYLRALRHSFPPRHGDESRPTGQAIYRLQLSAADHPANADYSLLAEFHTVADPGDPARAFGDVVGNYTGKDTASREFVSSISNWLRSCHHHTRCWLSLSGQPVRGEEGPPLPTRCVDVWPADAGPRLRLRNTAGEHGDYITLSHRWTAETDRCKTTPDNMDERLRGEGLDGLSQLFIDTFLLARRLQIRYVWIDSLCIIQGPQGDFPSEAGKMADYYQQSLFTVAHPGSKEGIGLYTQPDESQQPQEDPAPLIRMTYRNRNGECQGHFYLYKCQGPSDIADNFRRTISRSDMLTRGWIFQEFMLSRRIVCFTSSGMFLQCENELSPRTEVGERRESSRRFERVDLANKATLAAFDLSASDRVIFQAWEAVVEAYSGLQLTKLEEDRFVALSGVSNEFGCALDKITREPEGGKNKGKQRETDVIRSIRTYVAGLWLADIRRGLLWELVSETPGKRIASIPTWSWASISGSVKWPGVYTDDDKGKRIRVISEARNDCVVIDVLNPTFDRLASIADPLFVGEPLDLPGNDAAAQLAAVPSSLDKRRFPVLCIRAKLQPVLLGERFRSEEDLELARRLSGHLLEGKLMGRWHMVASPLQREHVAGWVSVDFAEEEGSLESCGDNDSSNTGSDCGLYALHVSRILITDDLSVSLGSIWPRRAVYNVLIVRRVELAADAYKRVGVGRLFGKEIEQGFAKAHETAMKLV
ncbi:hypothetical protein QBC47DRAFT_353360 [Echria macrotheca]|uniref:Heterokaryon incompatibility domain-containing protein n=1 Tax=Echria macrotheca TaxID=438768 RepID=A0AAJ0B4U6_9PEZI|nr:hypothetical protein QBC47DRAFT_353360 [Echria macrotheca]